MKFVVYDRRAEAGGPVKSFLVGPAGRAGALTANGIKDSMCVEFFVNEANPESLQQRRAHAIAHSLQKQWDAIERSQAEMEVARIEALDGAVQEDLITSETALVLGKIQEDARSTPHKVAPVVARLKALLPKRKSK